MSTLEPKLLYHANKSLNVAFAQHIEEHLFVLFIIISDNHNLSFSASYGSQVRNPMLYFKRMMTYALNLDTTLRVTPIPFSLETNNMSFILVDDLVTFCLPG